VTEYHVRQFDGPPHTCDGKNCACATAAMDIAFNTGGEPLLTADQVRKQSGVSCIPGAHSPSGGLFISDIERVCRENGVSIDFGRDKPGGAPKRWSWQEGVDRLEAGMFMHVLGDYDQMGPYSAQPGFRDDHSSGAHIPSDQAPDTCCFHDPLRSKPIDLPMSRLRLYWQKPGAVIRGYAGFTAIKEDIVNVYSVPGLFSAQWPKGAPVYPAPTGKATSSLGETRRLVVVGQDKPASPTRYLVDGAGDAASGRMAWLDVKGATERRDESYNAGVVAATGAAAKARR
jgi:hypothetical protein